jgi:hypothetical protein
VPELRHLRCFVVVAEELNLKPGGDPASHGPAAAERGDPPAGAGARLAGTPVVALAPESVTAALVDGITAASLEGSADSLETRQLWRAEHPAAAVDAFRSVAATAFGPA